MSESSFWYLHGFSLNPPDLTKVLYFRLYENDAYIGHRELDLKLTERVNMAMAGVPESGVDDWAAKLLAKGYRVAKVDQMETKGAIIIFLRSIFSAPRLTFVVCFVATSRKASR